MGLTLSRVKGSNNKYSSDKYANKENPNQERVVSWPPNAILITPLGYLRDGEYTT